MPEPRNYQTEAIVIRKTRLGEADRILTLFTPHLGKISAVAKGVRRPRSKMSGHLELLTHSLISLARGKNIDTVTNTQTINSFMSLKNDLNLTAYALYVLELTDQFTAERMENYPVFELLLETLSGLGRNNNKEVVLRYFEIHLLEEAGYRPELQQCVSCRTNLESVTNSFSFSLGGIVCPQCRQRYTSVSVSVNAQKALRFLQANRLEIALNLELDASLARELQTLLRGYIHHLLEREVKSAVWLDKLRSQSRLT